MFRRALNIYEHTVGPNHTAVARLLNSLANTLLAQHRLNEAEPIAKRAVAILEAAPDSEASHYAASLDTLAEVVCAEGRSEDATPLYERALLILEKAQPNGVDSVTVQGHYTACSRKHEEPKSIFTINHQ